MGKSFRQWRCPSWFPVMNDQTGECKDIECTAQSFLGFSADVISTFLWFSETLFRSYSWGSYPGCGDSSVINPIQRFLSAVMQFGFGVFLCSYLANDLWAGQEGAKFPSLFPLLSHLPLGECRVWDGHPPSIWSCLKLLYGYVALTSCYVGAGPTEKQDEGSSGHTLSIQTWALTRKSSHSHKEPKEGKM